MGILFCEGFIRSGINLGNECISIGKDGGAGLGDKFFSVLVSSSLGERNTEGEVFVDLFKISSNRIEESSLWVLFNKCSFLSCSFMGSNIGISNGIISNIWESREECYSNWSLVDSLCAHKEHCN